MKVIIIEDEDSAAQRLRKLMIELNPAIEILATLDSIESSVQWLQTHVEPDLIFADIHLADGPSFEIFRKVAIQAPIIFATAYDQYALQAFKFNGIDYLLKPIKKPELQASLNKYNRLQLTTRGPVIDYQQLLETLSGKKDAFQKRIVIRFGQTIRTLEIAEVAYFYTEEKITFACTQDGKRWPLDFTLDELDAILNPADFFRINRQFIIFIKAIEAMHTYSKSRIKIDLKPASTIETIVSTDRSADFKEWLLGK